MFIFDTSMEVNPIKNAMSDEFFLKIEIIACVFLYNQINTDDNKA